MLNIVYGVCEYEWDVYECNVRAQNQPFNPIGNVFKRIYSNLEYRIFFSLVVFLSILYICAMHKTILCCNAFQKKKKEKKGI